MGMKSPTGGVQWRELCRGLKPSLLSSHGAGKLRQEIEGLVNSGLVEGCFGAK